MNIHSIKKTAKITLVILSSVMLLLSGASPNLLVQPAVAVAPTPSPLGTVFGPNIYKIMVHVNGADKGSVSPYYHTYVSGYKENGYDQILFNMDHNLFEITGEEPYFGNFENLRPWISESTSSTVPGHYLVEQSPAQHIDGNNSLHAKASTPGAAFGSAGVFQNMLWQVSPVAANLNLKFSIYPVSLQSTTASPDSMILVELDFNYYDSATTVPKMFLVLLDNPSETLSGTPFTNSTNNVYYVLNKQTPLQSKAWNNFNLNITGLATQYYGLNKALNLKINGLHINAYSRNNATSEFYTDAVQLTSSNPAERTYSILSNLIMSYDTAELRLTSGEKFDLPSALLYFNVSTYLRPSGSGIAGERQVIETIHSKGDYVFLSKPDEGSYRNYALSNLWNVDGIAVYSTHNKQKGFAMDIWDYYLSKGVLAMGIAEEHPMNTTDVQFSATTAPTQYVYTDSDSTTTTVEAMAQGRGFVEAGYIRPTMPIFLSAENQQIPMGKFPIYVDSNRSTASLNINLQNIPFAAKTLRVIRNGTTINTISLQGLTSYNTTLTPALPDKSNYFRLEVLNANGTIIAFSNPIIYVKTSIRADIWLALSPSLQYGSASSSINSISYGSNKLSFTAKSRENILITTKIFTSKAPVNVSGAQSWNYDQTSNILTIKTKGTAQITITFLATTTTTTTTTTTHKITPSDNHKPSDNNCDDHGKGPKDNHENKGKHKGQENNDKEYKNYEDDDHDDDDDEEDDEEH
ncbi:MAG: hypothetical protein M1503_02145 [Thaumarchaeota archaeon]|nr:hypothetical protein [Nitrososphaerota archaeon]MCL5317053.1 hypothetical protein [Nitrososphaerota archaeon]